MTKIIKEVVFENKKITIETGELAKQTSSSVLIKCGETSVLVTVVMQKHIPSYLIKIPVYLATGGIPVPAPARSIPLFYLRLYRDYTI